MVQMHLIIIGVFDSAPLMIVVEWETYRYIDWLFINMSVLLWFS